MVYETHPDITGQYNPQQIPFLQPGAPFFLAQTFPVETKLVAPLCFLLFSGILDTPK